MLYNPFLEEIFPNIPSNLSVSSWPCSPCFPKLRRLFLSCRRLVTPQHYFGKSCNLHAACLVLCRRLAPLCPAWEYEWCCWCHFGAGLGLLKRHRSLSCSFALGSGRPGVLSPALSRELQSCWLQAMVVLHGALKWLTADHHCQRPKYCTLSGTARGFSSLCHVPLLPVRPSAGSGCASLPLSGTPWRSCPVGQCIRPPASPSGDFLSSSASILRPWRIPAWHYRVLVALTAVQFSSSGYLCVPFNYFKYTVCISGTNCLMPLNLPVYHCLPWLSSICQSNTWKMSAAIL